VLRADYATLWVDRVDDIHMGDMLAASYVNGPDAPLRHAGATMTVGAVFSDGRIGLTQPWYSSIAALVANPEVGDWLYRVPQPAPCDHAKELAMQAWFCSRGANGAGQWPGDPEDFAKQIKARDEFEAWWKGP
jgi:hypothetical protein